MGHGVEANKRVKGGFECFQLSLIFLLVNISSLVVPVTGYYLKTCWMSGDNAMCHKLNLHQVPKDIPPTAKGFFLAENKISILKVSDFKNLFNLKQLDLKRNYIAQIQRGAFADLVSLKIVNLNNNRLVRLEDDIFVGLSNLTDLRINRNRIKVVSPTAFMSLTSLKLLDISGNKLHRLAKVHLILQNLPNLQELVLAKNDLTTFQSHELTNQSIKLRYLDLSNNPIAVFRVTEDVFPNLIWLNIGVPSTKLKMKWDIHNKTFLSHVSMLDISGLQMDHPDMKTLQENFNPSLTTLRMGSMRHTRLTALVNTSCTIPSVSSLQLKDNNLLFINSDFFELCVNVTELDLSNNKIRSIDNEAFRHLKDLRILSLTKNKLLYVPAATRNLTTLVELDLSKNDISTLECGDFANMWRLRQLSLHQNSINALKQCVFKDLIGLQVLKLQNNSITKIKDTFKMYFPNLIQLRLNQNKLTAIEHGLFKGLQALQNLSLNENLIAKLVNGSFIGLTNLTELTLGLNKLRETGIHEGAFDGAINLKRLDLGENQIKYFESRKITGPLFTKLSRLESLNMHGNSRRKKSMLPSNFLQGLTNLVDFSGRNMQLISLHKDTFSYTPRLQMLDISSNDLTDLSPELFYPIRNLKSLYISRTSLQSLDFFVEANLKKLEFLQARKNQYSVFTDEVIESLPALVYVDLQGNSFTCGCDNAWFRNWIANNQTQVYDASNFVCNYPKSLKGKKLLDLDIRSCTMDTGFICFITTTCVNLLFMAASFTYHFLRWQLVYGYYLLLALLFDRKQKNKQDADQYDAFISYNIHDEPWVMEKLLPKLEGEQGWRLCLHHRDFEPGKPIIDNITEAIYGCRKTICVISHRYLESEWCSREIQAASFRLFDEHKDILILVFLEEIPMVQLSPYYRMRSLLKKRTFLSWPRANQHPEVFWEKLRQALKTTDNHSEDSFLLTARVRP